MEIRSISNIAAARPAASSTVPNPAESAVESAADASSAPDASDRAARTPGGFISPVLRYDQMAHVAVLFFRDFDSGETKDQIPAERVVEEYRRNALRVNGDREHPSDKAGQAVAAKSGGASPDRGSSTNAPDGAGGSPTGSNFPNAGVAAGGAISAPSVPPSVAYAAASASAGSGAAASSGATGGGAPGGLVSVTV